MRCAPLCWALIVATATAAALTWANLRTHIIVSESPSRFGMPWAVRVGWWRGWPLHHFSCSFTDGREEMQKMISTAAGQRELENYAVRHGVHRGRLAGNVAIAVVLTAITGMVAYWWRKWWQYEPDRGGALGSA